MDRGLAGMILSDRFKHAFKTALAVVIAYGIALHMDWSKPVWAGWTAFSISLMMHGEGIQKGLERLAGAFVGAVAAFVLLALFIQDRWLFVAFLSLYSIVSTYLAMGTRRYNYFWQQAGFFAGVIAFSSAFDPVNAFAVGVERLQETGCGLLTYVVVSVTLWHRDSRGALETTALHLNEAVTEWWQQRQPTRRQDADRHALEQTYGEILKLEATFLDDLHAAELDSWAVAENRELWPRVRERLDSITRTIDSAYQGSSALPTAELDRLMPDLAAFVAEIDRRLDAVGSILAGREQGAPPRPVVIVPDAQAVDGLSERESAALAFAIANLEQLERDSRALVATIATIKGDTGAQSSLTKDLEREKTPQLWAERLVPDPDKLAESLRVGVSAWLMFLAAVYIPDLPDSLATVGFATRIALADTSFPMLSVKTLLRPITAGLALAFVAYVFVMPQLASFVGLAIMLFAVMFLLTYSLVSAKLVLWRTLLGYLFLSVIDINNVQDYDFLGFAATALMWLVVISVLTITEYIPVNHQPERMIARMTGRFFASCQALLALPGRAADRGGLMQRLRAQFHRNEIAGLPGKLAAWGRALPASALGRSTPEQFQLAATEMRTLAYRLQAFVNACAGFRAIDADRGAALEVGTWTREIEDTLAAFAADPGLGRPEVVKQRIGASLARIEAGIDTLLDSQVASTESRMAAFRVLANYRGFSRSLSELADRMNAVDWARLREPRF